MKYLPFLQGKYSTAPGLIPMSREVQPKDRLIFHLDDSYADYLANKVACRQEDIGKYYTERDFEPATAQAVNQYLVAQMTLEYPEVFVQMDGSRAFCLKNQLTGEELHWEEDWLRVKTLPYRSLFDALCSQVPEDIAVCQLAQDRDWLAALHLCAPNHWAARDKIGKPFDAVHATVPDMEKTIRHYPKMLEMLVQKGPFTRFAWGLATDTRLNHHPEAPPNQDPQDWQGRQLGQGQDNLFLRVERQNMVGFPGQQAFIFTIRTYFYPAAELSRKEKEALMAAVLSMSDDSLQYKGLSGRKEVLRDLLALD